MSNPIRGRYAIFSRYAGGSSGVLCQRNQRVSESLDRWIGDPLASRPAWSITTSKATLTSTSCGRGGVGLRARSTVRLLKPVALAISVATPTGRPPCAPDLGLAVNLSRNLPAFGQELGIAPTIFVPLVFGQIAAVKVLHEVVDCANGGRAARLRWL